MGQFYALRQLGIAARPWQPRPPIPNEHVRDDRDDCETNETPQEYPVEFFGLGLGKAG
jgi:hypothetical protein